MTRTLALLVALPFLVAPPASFARGDYWVDAALGDDAAGTGARDAPWRTLTHALAQAPAPRTIHLGPGLYDAAHGETFAAEFHLAQETHLVGAGGSGATVLDAGGLSRVFRLGADTTTSFTGLTLRGAETALWGWLVDDASHDTALRDVVIVDVDRGLYADIFGYYVPAGFYAALDDVRVEAREVGVELVGVGSTNGAVITVLAQEVTVRGAKEAGLLLHAGDYADLLVDAARCRLEACGTGALSTSSDYASLGVVALNHSLVAGNQVGLRGSFWLGPSTVVGNGVGAIFGYMAFARGSILYGNGDDVVLLPSTGVEYCDIGDGDRAGIDGNFAADPLFLDPAAGDWRLAFGSPCVDAGDPDAPAGELDLAGVPRPVDGDLDASERIDVGALELAPLTAPGQASIGSTATLELWGPAGGSARLLWARGFPRDPIATPFGELELERGLLAALGVGPTAPGPPATFPLTIPADPAWIGEHLSLQALTASPNHPLGAALTNAVVVEIVP